ncbi:OmpH family outer membrane protein [Limisphaera ngatamarikiensis]|uniref:OmpH family outer membrane protein n=1 Tax=Limisphaera ngatamarikiensis TaxID=1324935 RepID=A0A6M1RR95_9BACT|nr:OmpH family outer membrane protein [Limisphaera ngatamarikiensis]NGO37801.1 OmpH family outer membrane protein [Limisphaera ngatamarikiensis]
MTKRLASLFALVVSMGLAASALGQGRIATVDLNHLFDNYWKTREAEAALKKRASDLEQDHRSMLEELRKHSEEYQRLLASATDQAVSEEERERRKQSAEAKLKQMRDLQESIAQFERQARATIDEQRNRMRNNLLGEIRTAVQSRARAAGYSLVLDVSARSAQNTPIVLYSSGDNDITQAVLDQLNLNAPASATGTSSRTKAP